MSTAKWCPCHWNINVCTLDESGTFFGAHSIGTDPERLHISNNAHNPSEATRKMPLNHQCEEENYVHSGYIQLYMHIDFVCHRVWCVFTLSELSIFYMIFIPSQTWQNITMAIIMMTSSSGNIFRVTDHLCGRFTGHRWISRTKASCAELWCFLWTSPE